MTGVNVNSLLTWISPHRVVSGIVIAVMLLGLGGAASYIGSRAAPPAQATLSFTDLTVA